MAGYGVGVPSHPDYQWVSSAAGAIPPDAVLCGYDNGQPIYVGRAYYSGALLPGKIHVAHGCCYVPWDGGEHSLTTYEVLCTIGSVQPAWQTCYGSNIPPNAVQGGVTENGEPLYVGRHSHKGSMVPGKVQRSHSCLYIAYGGREHSYRDYEVLIAGAHTYVPPPPVAQPCFPPYPGYPNYPQPPGYPYPSYPGNPPGTCPPW